MKNTSSKTNRSNNHKDAENSPIKDKRDNNHPSNKSLHPKNIHNLGYNYAALSSFHPPLAPYVYTNAYGNDAIDFTDEKAIKTLNQGLLKFHYGLDYWDIPEGYLCPPIPGRADYIHYIADLIGVKKSATENNDSQSDTIRLLDIGTGANGVYSLLANRIYGWQCVASDIDPVSVNNLDNIVLQNSALKLSLETRLQPEKNKIFKNIIQATEKFDITVCNPPFHDSPQAAEKANQRKNRNLNRNRREGNANSKSTNLNFKGQHNELWCKGGELKFLARMINESQEYASQCRWFSTLVSKQENIAPLQKRIKKKGAKSNLIEMNQGNKKTRILAWQY